MNLLDDIRKERDELRHHLLTVRDHFRTRVESGLTSGKEPGASILFISPLGKELAYNLEWRGAAEQQEVLTDLQQQLNDMEHAGYLIAVPGVWASPDEGSEIPAILISCATPGWEDTLVLPYVEHPEGDIEMLEPLHPEMPLQVLSFPKRD